GPSSPASRSLHADQFGCAPAVTCHDFFCNDSHEETITWTIRFRLSPGPVGEMGGERAGREIGDAAGRERDHEGDRARWIGLRVRDDGPGRRRAGDERHELAAPHALPLVRGIKSYHIARENAASCTTAKIGRRWQRWARLRRKRGGIERA